MPQFCKAFLDSSMHARKERRVGQICMKGLMHLLIHRNHPWQHRNLQSQYWEGDFCEYLLQNRYRQTTKQHNKLTLGTELLKKLPRSITKQQVPHLVSFEDSQPTENSRLRSGRGCLSTSPLSTSIDLRRMPWLL